jgi:hypothetical protein
VAVASSPTNSFSADISHWIDAQLYFSVAPFSESSLGCIVLKVSNTATVQCISVPTAVVLHWALSSHLVLVLTQVMGRQTYVVNFKTIIQLYARS